jgi:methionyl-tRNA synthetase
MAKKNHFQISTAIDYPSGLPHMGHLYEKVTADVLARWNRLKGNKVHFSTGLDCHGSKIEKNAKESGKTPKEFVKYLEPFFLELCKEYSISYDDFIKTTESRHKKVVAKFIKDLHKGGHIYKGIYSGYYCSDCETYFSKEELLDGKNCPTHDRPTELLEEESYFLKMSKFQKRLTGHIKKDNGFIQPLQRKNEILNRLKEPLRDLSLTREKVEWGIPFPLDKKLITAIWSEALLNYLTTVDYPNKKYKEFWPALHVIGLDITWHHTIIWGSMLLANGIKLPKVFVHGFIRSATGEKMSKSIGNVIDPLDLVKLYPSDTVRYYLLRSIPFGGDGDFSEEALVGRLNNELADQLGNLVSRTLSLSEKNFKKVRKNKIELELDLKGIETLMETYALDKALAEIFRFIQSCNQYINQNKVWELEKEDKETKVYNLLEGLRVISLLLYPFIPETSEKINSQLKMELGSLKDCKLGLVKEYKVKRKGVLFKKVEQPKPPKGQVKLKEKITFEDFDLRVAEITGVKDHPNADKLYILKLDIGKLTSDDVQIVSGLKENYGKEELIGKKIILLRNLKEAVIRGVESQGMLLAVSEGKKLALLAVEKSRNGTRVFTKLREKAKDQVEIEDFEKIKLISEKNKVVFNKESLRTEKEEVKLDKKMKDGLRVN